MKEPCDVKGWRRDIQRLVDTSLQADAPFPVVDLKFPLQFERIPCSNLREFSAKRL
jgi:hypothetical protein